MIKEIKLLLSLVVIFLFFFFIVQYYFSDSHKKKSFRSLTNFDKKIDKYAQSIPSLKDDTHNIIEFVKNNQTKKKKKYYFWELLGKDE